MFGWRRRATIIGEGLKVTGRVTAEGVVEVMQIEGEDNAPPLFLLGRRSSEARSPPATWSSMARSRGPFTPGMLCSNRARMSSATFITNR